MSQIKIVTFVPVSHANNVRSALGEAGAGIIGEYRYCSFSVAGTGRYIPSAGAKPFIGSTGQLEETEEERIEVVCNRTDARHILNAIHAAHPYQESATDIYELLDEKDL